MGRPRKTDAPPDGGPEIAPTPPEILEDGLTATSPSIPPGNPLTWTVEQWLAATGVPVDKIGEELARLASQSGPAGIAWLALKNIWEANTSPAQREAGVRFILQGLAELAVTGKGPTGHAGAELA